MWRVPYRTTHTVHDTSIPASPRTSANSSPRTSTVTSPRSSTSSAAAAAALTQDNTLADW